jgi:hypothetical protein
VSTSQQVRFFIISGEGKMLNITKIVSLLVVAALTIAGCARPGDPAAQGGPASPSGADYLLAEKPADAQPVGAARQSEDGGEEVAVEGRIGGSEAPFVDGIAAFTIVDPAVPYCMPEEGCPTPWDYCCQTDKLKDNSALVKIVGPDGRPLAQDARDLLGVKELARVVVRGKAQRDANGNMTVLAEKVHVVQE